MKQFVAVSHERLAVWTSEVSERGCTLQNNEEALRNGFHGLGEWVEAKRKALVSLGAEAYIWDPAMRDLIFYVSKELKTLGQKIVAMSKRPQGGETLVEDVGRLFGELMSELDQLANLEDTEVLLRRIRRRDD